MRHFADPPYLHARIYALKSRLYSQSHYAGMIREPETIPGNDAGSSNPAEIRETLFRHEIAPVLAIAWTHEEYTPLFIAYLRQYETNNAKVLLAKAAGHQTINPWYDIGVFALLSKELLKKELSWQDVRSLLAEAYQDEKINKLTGYRRLTLYLDFCTADSLCRCADLLSAGAADQYREMMLKRLAILVVIWSNRLKTYYRFSDEKIERFLKESLSFDYKGLENRVSLEKENLNRRLETMRAATGQEPSVSDIEQNLEQHYYNWISSAFHRDFHAIYSVVAYLWLLYFQIRNLFKIIEGKRFGMPAATILNQMICGT